MEFFLLFAVQSKTIFNEHDEVIGETDQKLQSIDELSTLNEESDEEKRTYRPDVYFPKFSKSNSFIHMIIPFHRLHF